jgi:hypothetical protein
MNTVTGNNANTMTPTVYKSCNNYIVSLEKLPDTKTNEERPVHDKNHAKFRADKLKVVKIEHKLNKTSINLITNSSFKGKEKIYEVGKVVNVDDFNENIYDTYASGIHYFLTSETAFAYEFTIPSDYSGKISYWESDGMENSYTVYKNGKVIENTVDMTDACNMGYLPIVKYEYMKGNGLSKGTVDYEIAMDVAESYGHQDIVKYLETNSKVCYKSYVCGPVYKSNPCITKCFNYQSCV